MTSKDPVPLMPSAAGSPRIYLVTVALGLLLLASIIPSAMVILSHGGVTKRASGSTRFIYFLDKKKQRISDTTAEGRLVLLGGSSALFSVRAKVLQSQLGIPVINDALQAGLGADYLLYRAKKVLRPGDTAILFLEYDLYSSESPTWTLADYLLPHDLPYFWSQSFSRQLALIGLLTPSEYGARLLDTIGRSPSDLSLKPQIINSYGDFVRRGQSSQTESEREQVDHLIRFSNAAIRSHSAETIAAFVNWCRSNGIGVIAGSPAFLDAPQYHEGGEAADFFLSVERFYDSMDVPVLGHPSDFFFEKTKFADTEYHLNGDGAAEMTDKVGRALGPILQNARNSVGYAFRFRSLKLQHLSRPVTISFANSEIPLSIDSLSGFSETESWGRWTDGPSSSIVFSKPLPSHPDGHFKLPHFWPPKFPHLSAGLEHCQAETGRRARRAAASLSR